MNVEKNLDYYLNLPLHKLRSSNFIPVYELTFDMKLGLYYLMQIYDLAFCSCVHGDWEFITLHKANDDKYLNAEDIRGLEMDLDKYHKFDLAVRNGVLPEGAQQNKPKKRYQPFGFLSPTGQFVEGEWGTHESEAYKIIQSKGFEDEYDNWDELGHLCRDFLIQVKGYVLIHNPSNDGGYIVTHTKPLTKSQREFLYNYFDDIGDKLRAKHYLEEAIVNEQGI